MDEIDRKSNGTLVAQVMASIRKHIASRQTAPGVKLPSIRDTALRLKVSKSTVVEAFDRLVAEGTILSRPGSGFYIAGHLPPLSLSVAGPNLEQEVDPVWITRQSLDNEQHFLQPGCGWLPSSWMPQTEIRRALRAVARNDLTSLTDYSTPQGLPALRQLLSRRLADRAIEAPPQQIILTESGTQAIDLLCRFFLEPDDVVVLDDPCYFNFHAMLRAHRVKVVGVPYTSNGPDLEVFERTLKEHKPRLYITNSALHNPTGATLSPAVAHQVLKLAEQNDLLIIEDDIFADFEHAPAPRLAAFDGLNRVIHIGSFSKTLSAAVRCGFIAVKSEWVDQIVDLKLATAFGGGSFSSELVLSLLKDGGYRRHINGLRNRLATAMGSVSTKLKAIGLTPWIEPDAGMFLWCQLPHGINGVDVTRYALAEQMMLAPGNAFSLSQNANDYLRFNVAQSLNPSIFPILQRAIEQASSED
ncbi:PLP-dependent aminotransferase family protein [Maritalea sp.]|uniref:aminotransferase-like domain-containing protein n=1 Tax=Maritalea sp. TaxID=2003361 RepID=UPI003EF66A3D